jgi:hypothetical protein
VADESGAEGTVSIVGVDELDPARGKERRESSGSTNWSVASKLLKKRQGEVAEGKVVVSSVKQEKYTVNEMLDYLLVDHEMNAKTKTATYLVKHLRQCFGFDRAMFLTGDRLLRYQQSRMAEGASKGTVRLELAALSRAYNLAISVRKLPLHARPTFPKISLSNARQGFVSHSQFMCLLEKLPAHLRDPIFVSLSFWLESF